MIEVEKKFLLQPEEIDRLIEGAKPLGEKIFTDVYYDNSKFDLTGNDKWLRARDGKFELKLPMNYGVSATERLHDQYEELENPEDIARAVGIIFTGDLKMNLEAHGFAPFATITTTRKKFEKGEFHLDFDTADYGFSVAEIEVMVEDASQMDEALAKIRNFAEGHGLQLSPILGKVPNYIKKFNPKHYQFLVDKGVI